MKLSFVSVANATRPKPKLDITFNLKPKEKIITDHIIIKKSYLREFILLLIIILIITELYLGYDYKKKKYHKS
jgi:hypothetical protein